MERELLAAGLVEVETRSFLLDLPAPLSLRVREEDHDRYVEWRERFGHLLDGEDIEVLADRSTQTIPTMCSIGPRVRARARTGYVARRDR